MLVVCVVCESRIIASDYFLDECLFFTYSSKPTCILEPTHLLVTIILSKLTHRRNYIMLRNCQFPLLCHVQLINYKFPDLSTTITQYYNQLIA